MTKYSLILIVFLVSCLSRSPKQEAPPVCLGETADRAAFDVDEIEYEFVKLPDSSTAILDSNFLVKFKACVKDSLKKQPMRNLTFTVHTFRDKREPEKDIKSTLCENVEWGCLPRKTNNDGCFKWSEHYSFPLPAEQQWIEFKRVIVHPSGSRIVPMMINPWIPSPKIIDLRPRFAEKNDYLANNKTVFNLHNTLSESADSHKSNESEIQKCKEEGSLEQAFEYLNKHEKKAFLWVDKIEFNPSLKAKPGNVDRNKIYQICDAMSDEECDKDENLDREGGFLNLNLKIPVKITSSNESGRIDPKFVPAGAEFEITFYLISEVEQDSGNSNGKKYYMLHRRRSAITAAAGSEYIHLDNAFLHIPYETTEGTSTILLKVESLEQTNMDPFYGVYDINDKSVRDLHGVSASLSLRSSNLSPDKLLDLEKVQSKVESQRQRIKEYQVEFDKFDKEGAYAQYKPTVLKDGFDYSKGLALDLSRMRFARIKASGTKPNDCSSPVKRTVVYLGEVCLRDPRVKQYLEKRSVTVTAQDMSMSRDSDDHLVVELTDKNIETIGPEKKRTDERGCIQFTYQLSHKLYDVQKYFMKKLTFKTKDLEESKYIALNPWEYGFLTYQEFTQAYENWDEAYKIYKDCKGQDCSNKKLAQLKSVLNRTESDLASSIFSENLKPPTLMLNEYRNVIIEPSYLVQPSLDVQVVKNLQMFLQPQVVRRDSPGEDIWQIPRVLPIGYYLVRFIIAKGPFETYEEGKRLLLDRNTLKPFQESLKLFAEMGSWMSYQGLSKAYQKISAPTQTKWENSKIDDLNLDNRADEAQQAIAALEDLYQSKSYDEYEAQLKIANAKKFFGGSCEKGGRIPCFTKEDYITHFDTVALSMNGVLNTFVKLGFNVEHFRHLGSKNSILIEVYPTDPAEYKYKASRSNRCELDLEQTTFKPFRTCAEGEINEDCHQLKTPAHWGLFFTTEFGMVNIMWPTERDYNKVFEGFLKPIVVHGKSVYEQKREEAQLSLMEDVLKNVESSYSSSNSFKGRVHQAYEMYYKDLVSSMDNVNLDAFNKYCKKIEKKIAAINDFKNSNTEEWLRLGAYICGENMETSMTPLRGETLKHQISKYFVYRDFSDMKKQANIEPLQKFLQVQNQEGGFCDETPHRATALIDGDNDWSEEAVLYHDCVCDPPNDESITKKMARCFAQSQGLVFVEDNQDFLDKLKNSPKNQNFLDRWKGSPQDQGFAVNVVQQSGDQNLSQDFLQSMCAFWFHDYYKDYLNFNSVEDIFNKSASQLKFLYNNPYVKVTEEDQLEDVNFDDFKNISTQGAGTAQWFQSVYSQNEGYEPFKDYKKTSDSNHPFYICRRDPLKFFHWERKIIVGALDMQSHKSKYKSGRVYSLITQASQGAQMRVELNQRQQVSATLRGEVRLSGGDGRLSGGVLRKMLKTTFGPGMGMEAARAGSTSTTEQNATDSTKSILLAVNHIKMDLALKKHRSCLVIRPKTNAFKEVQETHWIDLKLKNFFSNSLPPNLSEDAISLMRLPYTDAGLLICDEESSESLVVPEDYYYVHQFFGGHAYEFMSRTIYHNRPYTEILRGRDQMDKFVRLTHTLTYNREARQEDPFKMDNLIKHLDLDRYKMDHNLIQAFEENALDGSGFYKGIYTYPDLINYYDSTSTEAQGWLGDMMDGLGRLITIPKESIHR